MINRRNLKALVDDKGIITNTQCYRIKTTNRPPSKHRGLYRLAATNQVVRSKEPALDEGWSPECLYTWRETVNSGNALCKQDGESDDNAVNDAVKTGKTIISDNKRNVPESLGYSAQFIVG